MCTIVRTCVLCFLVSGAVGTFDKEVFFFFFAYEAFFPFRLCSTCAVGFSPRGNSFGSFATGPSSFSLSRPSGGQESRGGGPRYAPGILSGGASSPSAGLRSSEKGGSASGFLSLAREHALTSLTPSGAGEG